MGNRAQRRRDTLIFDIGRVGDGGETTLRSVAGLGLIVLIRIVLSFALEVEMDGVWSLESLAPEVAHRQRAVALRTPQRLGNTTVQDTLMSKHAEERLDKARHVPTRMRDALATVETHRTSSVSR